MSSRFRMPASITLFAPQKLQYADLSGTALQSLFTTATWAGLRGFARFIEQSRGELEAVLVIQQRVGVITKSDVERASEIVTAAACFAKITLKDLIAIHRRLFREFDVAELSYHANLLDDVLQGKSPLIEGDTLIPVRTDFQLRDVRVRLNAEAWVAGGAQGDRIMVRNISRGGLGFDGAGSVSAGQAIEVRLLQSGRKLQGRIVWKVGDKAGVEFPERLDDADPLFGLADTEIIDGR
ncbi:MAG: PilZ domain-containing protein [Hyphomicrobiaceae bacterium]